MNMLTPAVEKKIFLYFCTGKSKTAILDANSIASFHISEVGKLHCKILVSDIKNIHVYPLPGNAFQIDLY